MLNLNATMTRSAVVVFALISAFIFPWIFTAGIAFFAALWIPLLPLAVGILLDVLYYAPQAHWFPLGTVSGALVTLVAHFVRTRLKAGIIDR